MSEQLTVIAKFYAKAGMESRVRDVLLKLLAPTRAEAGCINYDLHQSTEDPRRFALYENWTSPAELDKHLKMPYLQDLFKIAPEIFDGEVEITRWELLR